MATVVVTERIRGVAVCTTTQRRNQLESAAVNWARKEGFGLPQTARLPDTKYGSPAVQIQVDFPDRAAANLAWADIDAFNPSFLLTGSWVMQYTAREDGETVNETIPIHRVEWIGGVKTVTFP